MTKKGTYFFSCQRGRRSIASMRSDVGGKMHSEGLFSDGGMDWDGFRDKDGFPQVKDAVLSKCSRILTEEFLGSSSENYRLSWLSS